MATCPSRDHLRRLQRHRRARPAGDPGQPRRWGGVGRRARRPSPPSPAARLEAPRRAPCRRSRALPHGWAPTALPGPWRALKAVHDWVATFERTWNERLDRMDTLLDEIASDTHQPPRRTPDDHPPWLRHRHPSVRPRIRIERTFDAPAAVVFEAWTNPDYVRRWWSGDDAPVVTCEIDLRVGGSWRYVTRTADGVEMGWHGRTTRSTAPGRLVSTEVFEGFPEGEALDTMTLTERDGVTTMTVVVTHTSTENRDGHVTRGWRAACSSPSTASKISSWSAERGRDQVRWYLRSDLVRGGFG